MFWVIVFIYGTLSCNQSSTYQKQSVKVNEELTTLRFYYENGKMKAERTYKIIEGDTVLHGCGKLFYPSGQLQVELSYKEGKKQGSVKGYYENGMLEHVGWYKDDKQDSLWVWYYNYPEATKEPIQAIDFWYKGNPLSHQIKYYSSGNEREYLFYDPIGRLIYKREYEESGNYNDEGSRYPQIVMVNEKNNQFIKGDTLKARIYHILPPKSEANVFVRIEGLQDEWKETKSSNYYTPIIFENTLDKIGTYKLEVKLKLRDKQKVETIEFTNQVEFAVQ